jgi:hypothetical protein
MLKPANPQDRQLEELSADEIEHVAGGLIGVKTVAWAYDDESPKNVLPQTGPFVTLKRG